MSARGASLEKLFTDSFVHSALSLILTSAFGVSRNVTLVRPEPGASNPNDVLTVQTAEGQEYSVKVSFRGSTGTRNEVLVRRLAAIVGVPNVTDGRLVEPIVALGGRYAGEPVAVLERYSSEFSTLRDTRPSMSGDASRFLRQFAVWATYLAALGTEDRRLENAMWNPRGLDFGEIDFEDSFSQIGDWHEQLAEIADAVGMRSSAPSRESDRESFSEGIRTVDTVLRAEKSRILDILREAQIPERPLRAIESWIDTPVERKVADALQFGFST